jgi:hypothetical protein
MNKLLFYTFFIVFLGTMVPFKRVSAQSRELGVFLGGSYYVGDLNPAGHFRFTRPALGLVWRKSVNYRFAYKISASYGNLYATDAKSKDPFQKQRNLDFKSYLGEASGQLEFNFLKFHGEEMKYYFSPYTFIGFSIFNFYPKASINGSWEPVRKHSTEAQGYGGIYSKKQYDLVQVAVPFGIGLKYSINRFFNISAEWGLRKTFTDYLDDVSRYYVNANAQASLGSDMTQSLSDKSLEDGDVRSNSGRQRGNFVTKDWYSFAGIVISFKFRDPDGTCPAFK